MNKLECLFGFHDFSWRRWVKASQAANQLGTYINVCSCCKKAFKFDDSSKVGHILYEDSEKVVLCFRDKDHEYGATFYLDKD